MGRQDKRPKTRVHPAAGKVPRSEDVQARVSASPFKWTTEQIELDGPFGFSNAAHDAIFYKIIPRLHGFECLNWEQMKATGSHDIEFSRLSKEAQQRIREFYDDERDVYSLKIEGRLRVVGFRDGAICRIIWFDPEHAVCISHLKHT